MSRWITVANRLPFSLRPDGTTTAASGGLVSALSGVKCHDERLWVGCAPDGLTQENWPSIEKKLQATDTSGWTYQPVFTPKPLYDSYYNGTCNDALWPLLHYQPELVAYDSKSWKAYVEVNERIAQTIASVAKSDDLVWIHDFHLFLVPKLLKALRPELRTGFFLHVPFPSPELMRQLPAREEILESLLFADLVGFHDYSYLQNFCSSVLRILGVESEFLRIRRGHQTTRLGVFPVSIDTDVFVKHSKDPKIKALARTYEKPHFTFLGVDRLDYMKGLDLKLKAYRSMLRAYPETRGRVSLLQVAVPTRQGVPVYAKLARETSRMVGEINGEFSTPVWSPIHFIHGSVNMDQLVAMYRSTDALLVSSKRDGMNLVALEYLACQDADRPGVVLVSEFAGVSSTLSHAIPINPWDIEDTARRMRVAMEMPKQERLFRVQTMQNYLEGYTATDWAVSFIDELVRQTPVEKSDGPTTIDLSREAITAVCARFFSEEKPERIALFLDYDGTLVPIVDRPELAVMTPEVREELDALTRHEWLDLIVVSGRDSRFLEKQLSGLNVHIAAEHGAKYFDPRKGRWQRRAHRDRTSWYPAALKIMSDYAHRVPRSQVEKKHFSIAWHYRQSPSEYSEVQALKLAQELELGFANQPVSIIRGKKVVEIRAVEADKGVFARTFLDESDSRTAALAIGDDRTDEDLFRALKGRGATIRVGLGPSAADFALPQQGAVMPLLSKIVAELATSFIDRSASGAQASRLEDASPALGSQRRMVDSKSARDTGLAR